MPELKNPSHEKYCRLRAAGQTQSAAYQKAGFHSDRSNAAKFDARPEIQGRIAEIHAEEELLNPTSLSGLNNAERLEAIGIKAVKAGNLPVATTAFKVLAEFDGSGSAMALKGNVAAMTDAEIAAEILPILRRFVAELGIKPRTDAELERLALRIMNNPEAMGWPVSEGPDSPPSPAPATQWR